MNQIDNYSVQLALAVSRREIPFICRSLSGVEAVGTGFGTGFGFAQPAIVGVNLTELVDDLLNSYPNRCLLVSTKRSIRRGDPE
jgi:hypothetical protein